MQSNEGNDENVFVIEVCQNCKDHHWNTRHDQAKYQEYFNRGKFVAIFSARVAASRAKVEGVPRPRGCSHDFARFRSAVISV